MSPFDDGLRAGLIHTVLTRVAAEPRPTPSRAFVAAVRRGAPVDALIALATAWRLATLRDRPIALGTRVRAAGLALGVGGLLATSGAVALASVAGIAGDMATQLNAPALLEPERPAPAATPSSSPTVRPVVALPTEEPPDASPTLTTASPSASASPSPKPVRTPRPTSKPRDSGGGNDGSGSTPRPTLAPGGDDSGGDSGGTEPHGTPTAQPTDTPESSSSDGSSGG